MFQRFQELVAKRQLKAERECAADVAFLDRGLIDGYAYCVYSKVHIPTILIENIRIGKGNQQRYDKVFLLDPLPTYDKNELRKEDREMQIKMHKAIEEAYKKFGYMPIHVPVLPPKKGLISYSNRCHKCEVHMSYR